MKRESCLFHGHIGRSIIGGGVSVVRRIRHIWIWAHQIIEIPRFIFHSNQNQYFSHHDFRLGCWIKNEDIQRSTTVLVVEEIGRFLLCLLSGKLCFVFCLKIFFEFRFKLIWGSSEKKKLRSWGSPPNLILKFDWLPLKYWWGCLCYYICWPSCKLDDDLCEH